MTDTLKVSVFRGMAGRGSYQSFEIVRRDNQTVLDVVTEIQRTQDETLAYRFACRVGMCGSCAMTVNGVPRWTCRSHVDRVADKDRLKIGPLRNLPHIRDLVADMTPFFEKQVRAGGVFQGSGPENLEFANVEPTSAERQAADAGIECIGCGVCYAACDVVRWKPDYLGPAALNRAWTLVNDERDSDQTVRMQTVSIGDGILACHSHGSCAAHCPKGLNPTAAIAGLKRRMAGTWIGRTP